MRSVITISVTKTYLERLQRAGAILDERDHQDEKWGEENDHSLSEWMVILTKWKDKLDAAILDGNKSWRHRAIQVAAIALAMVEQTPESN